MCFVIFTWAIFPFHAQSLWGHKAFRDLPLSLNCTLFYEIQHGYCTTKSVNDSSLSLILQYNKQQQRWFYSALCAAPDLHWEIFCWQTMKSCSNRRAGRKFLCTSCGVISSSLNYASVEVSRSIRVRTELLRERERGPGWGGEEGCQIKLIESSTVSLDWKILTIRSSVDQRSRK